MPAAEPDLFSVLRPDALLTTADRNGHWQIQPGRDAENLLPPAFPWCPWGLFLLKWMLSFLCYACCYFPMWCTAVLRKWGTTLADGHLCIWWQGAPLRVPRRLGVHLGFPLRPSECWLPHL